MNEVIGAGISGIGVAAGKGNAPAAALRVLMPDALESAGYGALSQRDGIEVTFLSLPQLLTAAVNHAFDLALIPLEDAIEVGGVQRLSWGVRCILPPPWLRLRSQKPPREIERIAVARDTGIDLPRLRRAWAAIFCAQAGKPEIRMLPQMDRGALPTGFDAAIISEAVSRNSGDAVTNCSLAEIWRGQDAIAFHEWVWATPVSAQSAPAPWAAELPEVDSLMEWALRQAPCFVREWAESRHLNRDRVQRFYAENVRFHVSENAAIGSSPADSCDGATIVISRAAAGSRLSLEEARTLAGHYSLGDIAIAADAARGPGDGLRGDGLRQDKRRECRDIFLTTPRGRTKGTALDWYASRLVPESELFDELRSAHRTGIKKVSLQAEPLAELDFEYYCRLISQIAALFPFRIEALNPEQLHSIAGLAGISVSEALRRLHDAGMSALGMSRRPEWIDQAKDEVGEVRHKANARPEVLRGAESWADTYRHCHLLAIETPIGLQLQPGDTFTSLGGYFLAVRRLQDETGGFTEFEMIIDSGALEQAVPAKQKRRFDTADVYRLQAVCRLFFDNIPVFTTAEPVVL